MESPARATEGCAVTSTRRVRTTRPRRVLAPVALVVTIALAGCGGGSVTLPTASGSRTQTVPSISVSIPSITRPPTSEASETPEPTEEPSEEPSQTPTEEPAPTETRTATETATATATVTPTPRPTETPSETPRDTPSETPSPTPSASALPAPAEEASGGLPSWVWWLLAAAVVVGAGFLVVRARRRSAWDAEATEAEADVAWFARELLPQLQQAATIDALAGGWQVGGASRVARSEDRLTGLEASAPDESRRTRARTLRDAVRSARADVESVIASRDQLSAPPRLAASSAALQTALNEKPPAG